MKIAGKAIVISALCGISLTAQADIRVTYSTNATVSGIPYAGHQDGDEVLYNTFSASSSFIPIPVDPSWQIVRVRSDSPTTESIPLLVLSGDRFNGEPLRLLVGTADVDVPGFTNVVSDAFQPAATNFNGLSFASGSEDLRDSTVFALSITGDALGPTTVGGVRRFQVSNSSLTSGGNILASITATASSDPAHNADSPHDQFFRASPSIGYIVATNSINAPIHAQNGSILRVEVGPNPDCAGLSDSVIAGTPDSAA